jgi:PTS system nitrogen regulatory IIA component
MPYRTLNLEQTAEYLRLKPSDLQQLVRRQEIPCEIIGGRCIFRQCELDAWASRRILGMVDKSLADYHKVTTRERDLSHDAAIVTELTRPEFVHTDVPARTKPSLLREMTHLADLTGLLFSPDDLLASLEKRESLCSTAISDGIALLHPRNHEPYMFQDSFIVLGRTAHPLPFGAPDGTTTDIFFLICCQEDRLHLHVLARICMMCRSTHLISNMRQAPDAAGIFSALCAAESEIIKKA